MGRGIIIEEEINRLKTKVDRLESERDKYREALRHIVRIGYHGAEYVARIALKQKEEKP